jgi:hypothetical protein
MFCLTHYTVDEILTIDDDVQTCRLFDPSEWSRYLESAAKIRQQAYLKGAKLVTPERLNDLSIFHTELQQIKQASQEDLEELHKSMETIKAHAVNALTTFQLQNTKLENEFLAKEIEYRDEIKRLRDSIQSLSKIRRSSSVQNFSNDFESKYIALLQSSAEKERGLEEQINQLYRVNDELKSKLRINSPLNGKEEIEKLKDSFSEDQRKSQLRIKELTEEIDNLRTKDHDKETKTESPLAFHFEQAKLQESLAEAILKLHHAQDIFRDLENSLRSGALTAASGPALAQRSNSFSQSMAEKESEIIWEVDEFYRRGVLIQDLFQARVTAEVNAKSLPSIKDEVNHEASELELQSMKRMLEELHHQYRMLEDQYEKSEVESFLVSKELAHKNYLYTQLLLLQQQLASKRQILDESDQESQSS